MVLSITDITNHLKNIMPKGFSTSTTPFTTWVTEAINETIESAAAGFRELAFSDFIGDGVTTRIPLSGFNIALAPINQWSYPLLPYTAGGIASPTSAPGLALRTGGSTIPSGAKLTFGYAWNTASGQTALSPVATITTTAANQTVDVTYPAAPIGTTNADLFATIAVINSGYTGRVSAAQAVSTTAATTITGLGLGASSTLPLVAWTDPTTVAFAERGAVATLGRNVAADGTAVTSATGTSTVEITTALASGARLRVWYYRDPIIPSGNSTPIYGVADDYLYVKSAAIMHRYLANNHDVGAKDQHWQSYIDLDQQALGILANAAGKPIAPARSYEWATQVT